MSDRIDLALRTAVIVTILASMSGCAYDIEYKYDIPEDSSDCPGDTDFRSGGSSIRDRSGGSSIRDRNGGEVTAYCEAQLCPGGVSGTGEPIVVWHLDENRAVVARKTCPAT